MFSCAKKDLVYTDKLCAANTMQETSPQQLWTDAEKETFN